MLPSSVECRVTIRSTVAVRVLALSPVQSSIVHVHTLNRISVVEGMNVYSNVVVVRQSTQSNYVHCGILGITCEGFV